MSISSSVDSYLSIVQKYESIHGNLLSWIHGGLLYGWSGDGRGRGRGNPTKMFLKNRGEYIMYNMLAIIHVWKIINACIYTFSNGNETNFPDRGLEGRVMQEEIYQHRLCLTTETTLSLTQTLPRQVTFKDHFNSEFIPYSLAVEKSKKDSRLVTLLRSFLFLSFFPLFCSLKCH